jgi:hypothetical protein
VFQLEKDLNKSNIQESDFSTFTKEGKTIIRYDKDDQDFEDQNDKKQELLDIPYQVN